MRTKLSLLITFIGFAAFSYAQRTIQGTLLDAETRVPLPFANVTLAGQTYGTTSNEEGKFSFNLRTDDETDTLVIHFIGYATYKQALSTLPNEPLQILMHPQGVNLEEVIIRPQPPTHYIKKALANRSENYADSPFDSYAYYREAFFENDLPISFQEAAVKTHYTNYTDTAAKNMHQIVLHREPDVLSELVFMRKKADKREAKARKKAAKKGEEYDESEAKEFISAAFGGPDIVIEGNVIHEPDVYLDSNYFKRFDYSFGQPVMYEGRRTMVIDFESKKKVDGARYKGSIYLDDATLAIVKFTASGSINIPVIYEPILFMLGIGISDVTFETNQNYTFKQGKWYPNFTLYEVMLKLEEKHLFKANTVSDIYINLGYLVNDLKLEGTAEIPEDKRFNSKEPMSEQVHPVPGVTWEKLNIIP